MKKQTVTIRDIAKKAEVSVATVSRYLNESGYVEDEKRKRIAAIIEELDYRPNRLAQGLKGYKKYCLNRSGHTKPFLFNHGSDRTAADDEEGIHGNLV